MDTRFKYNTAIDHVMLTYLDTESDFHKNIKGLEDRFLPELIQQANRKSEKDIAQINEHLDELEEGVINTMDKLKKLAKKIDETKNAYFTGEQLRKTTLRETLKKGVRTGKYSLKNYVQHPGFKTELNDSSRTSSSSSSSSSSSASSRGGGKRKKTRKYRK